MSKIVFTLNIMQHELQLNYITKYIFIYMYIIW